MITLGNVTRPLSEYMSSWLFFLSGYIPTHSVALFRCYFHRMASLMTPKAAFELSPGARFQSKFKDVKLDLRNIHWSVTEKQDWQPWRDKMEDLGPHTNTLGNKSPNNTKELPTQWVNDAGSDDSDSSYGEWGNMTLAHSWRKMTMTANRNWIRKRANCEDFIYFYNQFNDMLSDIGTVIPYIILLSAGTITHILQLGTVAHGFECWHLWHLGHGRNHIGPKCYQTWHCNGRGKLSSAF